MSWQEQVLEVAEAMLKDAATLGVESSHLGVAVKGYAREILAIVKAYADPVVAHQMSPIILSNPIIDRAKKQAEDELKQASKTLRQEENVTSLGALVALEGGPDDGTLVAAPPSQVPVGAKTNFGSHIYQVTEQRGLLYVGEMER